MADRPYERFQDCMKVHEFNSFKFILGCYNGYFDELDKAEGMIEKEQMFYKE